MTVGALILAAGYSRRFGSDKRLACVNGEPMLLSSLHSIGRSLSSFCSSTSRSALSLAVLRAWDPLVFRMLKTEQQQVIAAPAWPVGIGLSVSTGLEALLREDSQLSAVLIYRADMPFVQPATLHELLSSSSIEQISVPVFRGQRGRPLVFGRRFFPELLQLQPRMAPEKLARLHPDLVREINVADPGILIDINYPGDFHAAMLRDRGDRTGTAHRRALYDSPAMPRES